MFAKVYSPKLFFMFTYHFSPTEAPAENFLKVHNEMELYCNDRYQ